jgi:hypothetical protein
MRTSPATGHGAPPPEEMKKHRLLSAKTSETELFPKIDGWRVQYTRMRDGIEHTGMSVRLSSTADIPQFLELLRYNDARLVAVWRAAGLTPIEIDEELTKRYVKG